MEGNIKQYLDGIGPILPAEIVSQETKRKIDRIGFLFSDFAASEYIMETHLNTEDAEADFSFRVLSEEQGCFINGLKKYPFPILAADPTWIRIIRFIASWSGDISDIWLEMDYAEYDRPIPQPCFFFNAGDLVKPPGADDLFLFAALQPLLDIEQLQLLWPGLQGVIQQLPPEAGLFQVGVMLARNRDRVRIFTSELSREQTKDYLSRIGWTGSFSRLEELFQLVHTYSDGQYILDFDVTRQGISEKIGINFGVDQKTMLPDFLEHLAVHQLCTEEKKRGVLAWPGSRGCFLGPDYGFSALINDISHFKAGFSSEEGIKVKAYLRFAGIYLKEMLAGRNFNQVPTERG